MRFLNTKNYTFKQKLTRIALLAVLVTLIFTGALHNITNILISPVSQTEEIVKKNDYEVFGFAPYWTIKKLDNVDWSVLTTLAYFGVPVLPSGNLDTEDIGYTTISTKTAKDVFEKAHNHGTRVVLTITQMENANIRAIMDDPSAQKKSIEQTVALVEKNGFDGVNIDFEYMGNPGREYMDSFTRYVRDFTKKLHAEVPGSSLTVSVYASAVKHPKIYDIAAISKDADAIFMMAYDFATSSSDNVIPTSPLYGHKEGKYWYDVSTAVNDFLEVMPSEKLILGLPWYGYNYPVTDPEVKADKYQGYSYYYWSRGRRHLAHFQPSSSAQTYAVASARSDEQTGWDDLGKVGWKAYREGDIWRMIFLDDPKSLKIKYSFAKDKKLAGVGVWALGFDSGTTEMWSLLSSEFGKKIAFAAN